MIPRYKICGEHLIWLGKSRQGTPKNHEKKQSLLCSVTERPLKSFFADVVSIVCNKHMAVCALHHARRHVDAVVV